MPYTFDPIFAVDPGNPANVAANAVVTIFAPGDTSLTPLTLSTPDGLPFENPVTTSSSGHAGAFVHESLGRVAWSGGGFTGFFTAYDDIKQEAVAARDAAQLAAENAAAELSARIEAGEFQGEPGRDGSNVVPTAQAIATEISTEGTPANTALTATIADAIPKPDMVGKLQAPFFIAHRGGATRYPEQSMEGFRAAAQAGFLLELDPLVLADGTIVLHHDATTGRVLTGADVALNTLTREQWLTRRLKPAIPGGDYAMPVLWDDFLAELGGRSIPLVHLQTSVSEADNLRILNSIVERGLEKCVIIQSFGLAHCLLAKSMGMEAMFLTGANDAASIAQWKDNGIEYLGIDYGWGQEHITGLINEGFKVTTFSVTTYTQSQTALGWGCIGVHADDPWALSTWYAETRRDPYGEGVKWVGSDAFASAYDSLVLLGDGSTAYQVRSTPGGLRQIEQGWAGELPSKSFEMGFTLQLGTEGTGNHTARIFLSTTKRTAGVELHSDWVLVLLRRNGAVSILKRTNSTPVTTPASATWAGLTLADGVAGTPKRFQLTINAAGDVTFKCVDTGDSITATAAQMQIGSATHWLSLGTTGADSKFSKITLAY